MHRFSILLARMITVSTLFAASVIAIGTIWYLSAHPSEVTKHSIFTGEPQYFINPISMLHKACSISEEGERRSVIMIGIFLLLMTPLLRVLFAAINYATRKNYLYLLISLLVFLILLSSFFS